MEKRLFKVLLLIVVLAHVTGVSANENATDYNSYSVTPPSLDSSITYGTLMTDISTSNMTLGVAYGFYCMEFAYDETKDYEWSVIKTTTGLDAGNAAIIGSNISNSAYITFQSTGNYTVRLRIYDNEELIGEFTSNVIL